MMQSSFELLLFGFLHFLQLLQISVQHHFYVSHGECGLKFFLYAEFEEESIELRGDVNLDGVIDVTYVYYKNEANIEDDTIDKIAKNYGVTPSLIGEFNDFIKLKLATNQDVKVPLDNVYVVKNNDTVDSILNNTNRSAEQLLKANASVWFKTGNRIYL